MRRAFTLIELLVAVTLMVILISVYFIVANPAGQLAASRNATRSNNLQAIMLVLRQYIADQGNETFSCASGALPTTSTVIESGGGYNLAPCLVPAYLPVLPVDPSASSSYYTSASAYDTNYAIMQNASGSITLSAPDAELKQVISITR
jgi:prepilin-type N-terminal cleavage/methylation domain-containing protein